MDRKIKKTDNIISFKKYYAKKFNLNQNLILYMNLNNNTIKFIELLNSKKINWRKKIKSNLFYKKIFCKNHFLLNNCFEGNFCNKAHSINELKGKFFFKINDFYHIYHYYKTQYCPFVKFNHDYKKCFYTHGYLDYRRPYSNILESKICKNFEKFYKKYLSDKNIEVKKYNICKNYDKCRYLHSYHEFQFHKKTIIKKNFNNNILGKILKKNIPKFQKINSDFFI